MWTQVCFHVVGHAPNSWPGSGAQHIQFLGVPIHAPVPCDITSCVLSCPYSLCLLGAVCLVISLRALLIFEVHGIY